MVYNILIMEYKTVDYLRDSYWLIDKLYHTFDIFKPRYVWGTLRFKLKFFSVDWKNLAKRLTKTVPLAFIIVYLGLLAVITLAAYSEKREGLRVVTITSGSMKPALPIASIFVTVPGTGYKVGDIVTYREVSQKTGVEFDRTITHRIIDSVKVEGETLFITKGDANDQPDPAQVKKEQILGKVIFIMPFVGYITVLVKTIPGFLIMVALPAYILIRNEIIYLKKELAI